MNSENLAKRYIIENKSVSFFLNRHGSEKTRGAKNEGMFQYVIENKWRKNVRFSPFHHVAEK